MSPLLLLTRKGSYSTVPSLLRCLNVRTKWTTATFLSVDPSTLVSRVDEIVGSSPKSSPDRALLYSISNTLPPADLGPLVSHIQSKNLQSIGCICDALPSQLAQSPTIPSHAPLHSLSIALWSDPAPSPGTPSRSILPFRSTIPGRPKIAVGREIKESMLREVRDERGGLEKAASGDGGGWREVWGRENLGAQVPDELESISDIHEIESIVFFSDDAPQGLMEGLDGKYSSASLLGLLASSTPFLTGRPFTLLKDSQIFSDGAVGLAICRERVPPTSSLPTETAVSPSRSEAERRTKIVYPELMSLGPSRKVTSSQGNIVVTLDDSNATRTLLKEIQSYDKHAVSEVQTPQYLEKGKEYYIGVFSKQSQGSAAKSAAEALYVARIVSGDPSRGALSVDSEENILAGQWVQFFHRLPSSLSLPPIPDSPSTITFISSSSPSSPSPSQASTFERLQTTSPSANNVTLSSFVASSEHGFVVAGAGNANGSASRWRSWVCGVGGAAGIFDGSV